MGGSKDLEVGGSQNLEVGWWENRFTLKLVDQDLLEVRGCWRFLGGVGGWEIITFPSNKFKVQGPTQYYASPSRLLHPEQTRHATFKKRRASDELSICLGVLLVEARGVWGQTLGAWAGDVPFLMQHV